MKFITLSERIGEQIAAVSEISEYLWQRQWAERNAGNISIRFDPREIIAGQRLEDFRYITSARFPTPAAGMVLFITGSGQRLRDLRNPARAGCILRVDDAARGYNILWGGLGEGEFQPTSEISSHIRLHLDMMKNNSPKRAVLHTHPVELIALSHHPQYSYDSAVISKILWSMLPEVRVFVPRGVGIIPYRLPGSDDLAERTVEGLRRYDVVIWKKHGAVAAGTNIVEAFDFIDVANKGAIIFLRCLAAGFTPEGMSEREMEELMKMVEGLSAG